MSDEALEAAWREWWASLRPWYRTVMELAWTPTPLRWGFRAGWEARGHALGAGSALSDAEMRRAADEVWVEWSSQWASHELLATSLWTLLQDAVRYGFAAGARRARTTEEGS